MCLELRHTTLIALEMMKVMDVESQSWRINPDREPLSDNLFSERTMRIAVEKDPAEVMFACEIALDGERDDWQGRTISPRLAAHWQYIGRAAKKNP